MFIEFIDDIASRPAAVARDLFDFLGVRPHDVPVSILGAVVNPTPWSGMPAGIRDDLVTRYLPDLERLADRFGPPCDGWLARHRGNMGVSK